MVEKNIIKVNKNRCHVYFDDKEEKTFKLKMYNRTVITSQQLARFLDTSVDNVRTIFNRNKEQFDEEVDYFVLIGPELKQLKTMIKSNNITDCYVADNVNKLYLWTEESLAKFGKILNNDRAWQIIKSLNRDYFRQVALGWKGRVTPLIEEQSKSTRKKFYNEVYNYHVDIRIATQILYKTLFDEYVSKNGMNYSQLELVKQTEDFAAEKASIFTYDIVDDASLGVKILKTIAYICRAVYERNMQDLARWSEVLSKWEEEAAQIKCTRDKIEMEHPFEQVPVA